MTQNIFYQRHLPHYQPPYATYFVTFRLYGSLPQGIIVKLKDDYQKQLYKVIITSNKKLRYEKYNDLKSQHFDNFEKYLHSYEKSPKWLENPDVASIVSEAIKFRDNTIYDLICYCIMPNHLHIVFSLTKDIAQSGLSDDKSVNNKSKYFVTDILSSLKRYTAMRANNVLDRKGQFWQHESYDHVIRDNKELESSIMYILNNPVKAGLTDQWQNWEWSYLKKDMLEM